MMEYTIVVEAAERFLVESVQAHLDLGWQLAGGVSVATYEDTEGFIHTWYAQALTRQRPASRQTPIAESYSAEAKQN